MADSPLIWDVGEDITMELVVVYPTTGLGILDQESYISLTIERASDNKYWNGSAWSLTRTVLSMTQANSTYQPGRYIYTLPGTAGNVQEDKYLAYTNIANPPTIEGDAYEVHVSRSQAVRLYESEPA